MRQIIDGVWHRTTVHEWWGIEISSYRLAREAVAIDPRVPDEGLEWFEERDSPRTVLLTNRHHYRDSDAYVARFGCRVLCHPAGLHEFQRGQPVEPFDPGDEPPGGVRALALGAICPDEAALHVPAHRAIAFADGLVRFRPDGPLGLVPDNLMDDPEATKAGLRAAFRRMLDLDVDHLLLAHGLPWVGGGREALSRFAAG